MTSTKNEDSEIPHNETGCRFHKTDQGTKVNEPHKKLSSLEGCDFENGRNDGLHNARNDMDISRLRNSEAGSRY